MELVVTATKAASLADDLVRRFEERIEAGAMPPGSRFPTEKAMAEDFGVSRAVVREAYSRLSARGLLVSRRGSGAYVADGAHYRAFQITAEDVGAIDDLLNLLEMRMGFEAEMADLAARRRTDADLAALRAALAAMAESRDVDASIAADAAFHAAIASATGNPHFLRFTQFLGVRLVPSRRLYLRGDDPVRHQHHAHGINRDHQAIYAAIAAGDPDAARRAARAHIDRSIDRYRMLKEGGRDLLPS